MDLIIFLLLISIPVVAFVLGAVYGRRTYIKAHAQADQFAAQLKRSFDEALAELKKVV